MPNRTIIYAAVSLLALGSILRAADTPKVDRPYRYLYVSGPKLAKAPTIDGTVNPDEWAGAGMAPRLVIFEREERLMDSQAKFYFGYTDDALWVAWQFVRQVSGDDAYRR